MEDEANAGVNVDDGRDTYTRNTRADAGSGADASAHSDLLGGSRDVSPSPDTSPV